MGKRIQSYSRLRAVHASATHRPISLNEIADILSTAGRDQRQVTFRAGGRSFDDQALNSDVVVDVSGFDRIVGMDVDRREVTVQCGARWDDIAAATLRFGLLPHILVTTPGATAGGTVSGNCLSRCSSRYGHTGDHVRALTLVTPAGAVLYCSRTENAEVFRAVIGGFGYFGLVSEITFDLLFVGNRRNVKSHIERVEGLGPFVERLIAQSEAPPAEDAVYSVFSLAEPFRGAIFRSSYTEERVQNQLHIYQPRAWYRPLLEGVFLSSRVSNAFCHASYRYRFGQGPFVDDFHGYTFCMEANEEAKRLCDSLGISMRSSQHSFVVPTENLLAFLEAAARSFAEHRVYPSLLDCLFRPADDYLLSSAHRLAGFCVSFMFEGLTGDKLLRMRACMVALNEVCIALSGRLHLVKNVDATSAQLKTMYGHATPELGRLKLKLDPQGVLRNAFFDRVFGSDHPKSVSAGIDAKMAVA